MVGGRASTAADGSMITFWGSFFKADASTQETVFVHETLHLDSDLRAQSGNDPDHNDLSDDAARPTTNGWALSAP
jgi:hypothetical protein